MHSAPKNKPEVVVTLEYDEACAIVRALLRAETPVAGAGNYFDVDRLRTLREGIAAATRGETHSAAVES